MTQPSDKMCDIIREELNRLHALLNKPEEKPGTGHPKARTKEWARTQIEQIHLALTTPTVEIKPFGQQEKDIARILIRNEAELSRNGAE